MQSNFMLVMWLLWICDAISVMDPHETFLDLLGFRFKCLGREPFVLFQIDKQRPPGQLLQYWLINKNIMNRPRQRLSDRRCKTSACEKQKMELRHPFGEARERNNRLIYANLWHNLCDSSDNNSKIMDSIGWNGGISPNGNGNDKVR